MNLQLPFFSRTGAPAAALALAMAIGVAACGGAASNDGGVVSLANPSGAPDASATPAASVDPEEAMLAFTKCMKEHGVDVQMSIVTEGSGGGGVRIGGPDAGTEVQPPTGEFDPKAMEEADKACRDLLPAAGMGDPNATMDPVLADQALKFAQCMRDHDVDFPDPVFSGNSISIQMGEGGIDPTSETFMAARAACGSDLPGGAPFVMGGSSSSGSGGGPAIEGLP